jgi:probable HAF family extracellular repeat protein
VTAQSFEGYGALAASADGSVIAGNEGMPIYDAFRWTSAGFVSLGFLPFGPQQPASSITACSADGSVLAGWSISIPGRQAFRWSNGGMVGIGDLDGGAFSSEAAAISADGSVIVGRGTSDNGDEAFMWSVVGGMRSIAATLSALGAAGMDGWSLRCATAVSADGRTIAGWGTNPAGDTEAWVARLPGSINCYVNCDGSTTSPVLNALDFACFLSRFASDDPYANCDGSTAAPVLNVLDFMCFLNHYMAGCS